MTDSYDEDDAHLAAIIDELDDLADEEIRARFRLLERVRPRVLLENILPKFRAAARSTHFDVAVDQLCAWLEDIGRWGLAMEATHGPEVFESRSKSVDPRNRDKK